MARGKPTQEFKRVAVRLAQQAGVARILKAQMLWGAIAEGAAIATGSGHPARSAGQQSLHLALNSGWRTIFCG